MPTSVRIKLYIGVVLSFFFMVFDFWFKSYEIVLHLGPVIVGITLVSAVLDAYKKKES